MPISRRMLLLAIDLDQVDLSIQTGIKHDGISIVPSPSIAGGAIEFFVDPLRGLGCRWSLHPD